MRIDFDHDAAAFLMYRNGTRSAKLNLDFRFLYWK